MDLGKRLLAGCGGCVGLVIAVSFVLIVLLGVGIETGHIPDTLVLARGKIPAHQVEQLRDLAIIEPGEEVLFFYSAGFLSIREDGNLMTDRRVISYQEGLDEELEIYQATWDEIESVSFNPSGSWFEDSTIEITKTDDSWFQLLASSEEGGDERFYEALDKTWRKHTGRGDDAEDVGPVEK